MIGLPKYNNINNHNIELEKAKQPLYRSIYSLRKVKLEILKTYIKNFLKTEFIVLLKSLEKAFILFDQKFNKSFCLYINYQDLNNLIIKNLYLHLLISKFLNKLGWAKHFIQLNLTNAYHWIRI